MLSKKVFVISTVLIAVLALSGGLGIGHVISSTGDEDSRMAAQEDVLQQLQESRQVASDLQEELQIAREQLSQARTEKASLESQLASRSDTGSARAESGDTSGAAESGGVDWAHLLQVVSSNADVLEAFAIGFDEGAGECTTPEFFGLFPAPGG